MSDAARPTMCGIPAATVAAEVSDANNNPAIEGWLRIYLELIERSGFVIVRAL